MKVWIEMVPATGTDGWAVDRWDVVTSEGHSIRAGHELFSGAYEAREWAAQQHQVMDITRPRSRRR